MSSQRCSTSRATALLAPGRPLLPGAAHTVSLEPGLRDRAGNAVAARAVAATAGTLFVRTYERGERVHLAMLLRGYDGTLPPAENA